MKNLQIWLCLASLAALGCDAANSSSEAPVTINKAAPIGGSKDDDTKAITEEDVRTIGGMRFDIPAGWKEKQVASDVLLAEFSLPGKAGNGRLTLSATGGGTAANLDRWRDQFRRGPDDPEAVESDLAVAGREAKLIEAYGTYSDMFSKGEPQKNWQLLGVAIPVGGEQNYFVKLTGPRETLAERRDEFLKFVKSARFEK